MLNIRIKIIQVLIIFLLLTSLSLFGVSNVAYAEIGDTYQLGYPTNLPSGDHETYGHPILRNSTYAETKAMSMNSKNNEYKNYNKYRVYYCNNFSDYSIINMPVVRYFNSYYSTSTTASLTKTVERTVTNSKTYEQELSSTISAKVGYQSGVKIDGIGVSQSAEVNSAVSNKVGYSNTIFISQRTSDTISIPPSQSQKYYMWEERANFEVFCIQVLEINYEKINIQSHGALWWKYESWDWKETTMVLKEEYYVYKYISGGDFFGLFEYIPQGNSFIYNGAKPSSSVLYI